MDKHVISINLESPRIFVYDYMDLYNYVKEKMVVDKTYLYFFKYKM